MTTSSMDYANICKGIVVTTTQYVLCSSIDVNFETVHSGHRGQFVKDTKIMGSDPESNHSIPVCCVSVHLLKIWSVSGVSWRDAYYWLSSSLTTLTRI